MSHSDEVPIFVYIEDPLDLNSVVVVPERTYLKNSEQAAHWLCLQGEIVSVEDFKQGNNPVASPVGQLAYKKRGHCKSEKALRHGEFKYTVKVKMNGTVYTGDPQLIVGN